MSSPIHSLSEFNVSLIGTFTWLTPPGPYRATNCRERELTMENIHNFLTTQEHGRASSDEGSAQCRGHLLDNTDMKDDTHHSHTHWFQQGEKKGLLWCPNILGTLVDLKLWHVIQVRKNPEKKPHPGNLSRLGIEPGPAVLQARMLPPVHSGGL